MPAKGRKLLSKARPRPCNRRCRIARNGSMIPKSGHRFSDKIMLKRNGATPMNKPLSESDLVTPTVTTGPIAGSRKVYSAPEAAPDLRVPLREIPLSEGAGEEPVRVYDPSGIYTEADAAIDVEKGLKRARIAWVRERGGVEEYEGRPIKPVDNGNVTGKHLARNFPNTPRPMRAVELSSAHSRASGNPELGPRLRGDERLPLTQLEWARA